MKILFYDSKNNGYDKDDVYHALLKVGADSADALFLHSDINSSGGQIPLDFNRKEYVSAFAEALFRLNKPLIVPTFTYSFCNQEKFNVNKTKTSMGSLNEYLRKQPKRYRTMDPLLSLSVPEELKEYFSNLSNHSLGKDSGLDKLHNLNKNIKFIFLGARYSECFTYLHYIEKVLSVPYYYDQPFTGKVIDENGNEFEKTQYIYTHCEGVTLREGTFFEDYLIRENYLKQAFLGEYAISCISESDAYTEIIKAIKKNPYTFVEKYKPEDLKKEYTYDLKNGRITHC